MSIMTDETADDFAPVNGPGTYTVGAYGIDPTTDKVGNVTAQVCGMGAAGATFHAVITAGWKMVGGSLTVFGLTVGLSFIPVALTGLVTTLVATGNEIQIRVTLVGGQNVRGGYKFSVMATE